MKALGFEVVITDVSWRHLVGLHFSTGPHALHVYMGPTAELVLTSLSGLKMSLELEGAASHTSESAWYRGIDLGALIIFFKR